MERKEITKFFKFENNKYVFAIILIGVIFMLFGVGGDKEEKKEKPTTAVNTVTDDEKRLESILSDIQGVGSVEVMITYYSTQKSDIAYETNTSEAKRTDNDNLSNEENSQTQAVMSDGTPFVTGQIYPEVKGVVVVCDGGGNILIKNQVTEAVMTVMGVASHKVCVAQKK